jgi:hypothetical protein
LAAQAQKEGYFIRVLIAFDMFVNVIFGGNNDETISSRSARAATEGKIWGIVLSRFLDLFQANHGAQAIVGDLTRAEDVESLEENSGDIPK